MNDAPLVPPQSSPPDPLPTTRMTAAPFALEYARQPSSSLASLQYRADGGVVIVIPPFVRRAQGKLALAAACAGVVGGPVLGATALAVASWQLAIAGLLLAIVITGGAIAALCVTLWMGLRWTVVEAGPEGLRRELRGLLMTRRWFIPRSQIGQLRAGLWIRVFDAHGRRLGRIDGMDAAEEAWLVEVLTRVLALPPPLAKRRWRR